MTLRELKYQLAEEVQTILNINQVNRVELARRMHTSHVQVHRMLNPENRNAPTLRSLVNMAKALGVKVKISFERI